MIMTIVVLRGVFKAMLGYNFEILDRVLSSHFTHGSKCIFETIKEWIGPYPVKRTNNNISRQAIEWTP